GQEKVFLVIQAPVDSGAGQKRQGALGGRTQAHASQNFLPQEDPQARARLNTELDQGAKQHLSGVLETRRVTGRNASVEMGAQNLPPRKSPVEAQLGGGQPLGAGAELELKGKEFEVIHPGKAGPALRLAPLHADAHGQRDASMERETWATGDHRFSLY